MSDPLSNKANVFYDASFVLATERNEITQADIARALNLPPDEIDVFSSKCVKKKLLNSMGESSRGSHKEKYSAAVKALKSLGGYVTCHGHDKGSASETKCVSALLNADTGMWFVGTCDPAVRSAVKRFPNVGLLRVEGSVVRHG